MLTCFYILLTFFMPLTLCNWIGFRALICICSSFLVYSICNARQCVFKMPLKMFPIVFTYRFMFFYFLTTLNFNQRVSRVYCWDFCFSTLLTRVFNPAISPRILVAATRELHAKNICCSGIHKWRSNWMWNIEPAFDGECPGATKKQGIRKNRAPLTPDHSAIPNRPDDK